ncbi:MAG: 2-hydroxyacid dehydrogenase [Nitrosomonas sp.]|nr:2-hydroxyacid dehydrogenase [Nitrosomonas sp.]
MKVAVFSTKKYDRELLDAANRVHGHDLSYFESHLGPATSRLAAGFPAVCVFVNDQVDSVTIKQLAAGGTRIIATRSTGFNHIDLKAAAAHNIKVVRVTDYSPYSVAEFAVGLLLTLNRKIHRAYNRTREGNFELDGLLGRDLHGQTVGIMGTGKIGRVFAHIMLGFGCKILGYDKYPHPEFIAMGCLYVEPDEMLQKADIFSLHLPLTADTYHIFNASRFSRIKSGALLVNTSRGGLIETEAAIEALKRGQLGGMAIDVYEQEADLFFQDHSNQIITDDVIQRLVSFPNVIVTGHQAFFTREAVGTISASTLQSLSNFEAGLPLYKEEVLPD